MAKDTTIKDLVDNFIGSVTAVVRNTHAGTALAGASIVSEDLRAAIMARMRPLSKTLQKEIFGTYGPLGTFASRIAIAFALEIIPTDLRADIIAIKAIRNEFAHSKEILNFNSPKVAQLCKRLSTFEPTKTDLQAVYMVSLKRIDGHLGEFVKRETRRNKEKGPTA